MARVLQQKYKLAAHKTERPYGNRTLSNDLVGAARVGEDAVELVEFALGTTHSAQTLLDELLGALVHAVLEELHAAALVGRKANDLAHKLAHKLDARGANLGRAALGVGARRDDVSAVSARGNATLLGLGDAHGH